MRLLNKIAEICKNLLLFRYRFRGDMWSENYGDIAKEIRENKKRRQRERKLGRIF